MALAAYGVTLMGGVVEASPEAHRSIKPQDGDSKPAAPQPKTPRQAPTNAGFVKVSADATQPSKGESDGPAKVCRLSASQDDSDPPTAWEPWVSLDGPRLAAESSEEDVPAYASKVPNGLALLLANHREAKAAAKLGVRLPRGVYSIERLSYSLENPETSRKVERLESVVLGNTATASKPAWLEPKSVVVYRFINQSAQTNSAFANVKNGIRAIMDDHRSSARLMMVPLRECESNVGALSRGIQPDKRYDCLKYIHRALLTASHAQALCQNQRRQGRLEGEEGENLEGAFDRLEDALTSLSAGCLNLVPGVEAKPGADPDSCNVTVWLTNAGKQSITNVKIGATAPEGSTVSPSERAFFGAVRPGETARATFTVKMPTGASRSDITADIAYFAARAPAHLRVKPI